MNIELMRAYQSALVFACLDDFTPAGALGQVYGGQSGPHHREWKRAVVCFIYRNLSGNLLEVNRHQVAYRKKDATTMARMLAAEDPSTEKDVPISLLWHGVFFEGSIQLQHIARSHGMLDWTFVNAQVNHAFMNEVLEIYVKCGVVDEDDLLLSQIL